jgi:hypothetical protein
VPATGCSDLGKGVLVLPDPFSRVTNLCSTDVDCQNVSVDLNVGKLLRDATGNDGIVDGGFSYPMHACASVEVTDRSCGLCVPCHKDADCQDVDVAKVAGGAVFGPVGSAAASLLADKVFGPDSHTIHMYCDNVVGDVGVCVPCPNMFARCAQTTDGIPQSGRCDHDVCEVGSPLGLQCQAPCVAQVCAHDPYCCTTGWDDKCKTDVDLYCADRTCEPDKCVFRSAGWYCFGDATKGGYLCSGAAGAEQIAEGKQCVNGQVCRTQTASPKAPAILCDAEGDGVPGCPTGSLGKPRCFDP